MSRKTNISPEGSAPLHSPRSHATSYENLVFVSGQVARNLQTNEDYFGSVEEETDHALRNIAQILECAGSSMGNVLKTTVFLTSKEYFDAMNQAYAAHFPGEKPARSTIIIGLAGRHKVEIEAVAYK